MATKVYLQTKQHRNNANRSQRAMKPMKYTKITATNAAEGKTASQRQYPPTSYRSCFPGDPKSEEVSDRRREAEASISRTFIFKIKALIVVEQQHANPLI